MFKKLLLFALLVIQITSYAQNPIWCIAPDYLEMDDPNYDPQPLPIPPEYTTNTNLDQDELDFYYYHGQSATTVSNAQADAQGNLLFFIVDDKVYDKEGYLIDAFAYLLISYRKPPHKFHMRPNLPSKTKTQKHSSKTIFST